MSINSIDEIVKLKPKGIFKIPKKLRVELGMLNNSLLRLSNDRGRLVVEIVKTGSYPIRSYKDQEIDEFLALDKKETKKLKQRKIIK